MNNFIAYCGLNCEICEARIATVNNDNTLREKVAKEWFGNSRQHSIYAQISFN